MDIQKSIREGQLNNMIHVAEVISGKSDITKSIQQVRFEQENDIQKGKPAVAGEIREWSGKKMKKQPNGKWVEVSEHGMSKKEHEGEAKDYDSGGDKKGNSKRSQMEKESASKLSDKEYDDEELEEDKEDKENKTTFYKEMPKSVAKDTAEYWGNKKELWNKGEISLSKEDKNKLIEVQENINKYHPEFNSLLDKSKK
jgi:hypothetical protein